MTRLAITPEVVRTWKRDHEPPASPMLLAILDMLPDCQLARERQRVLDMAPQREKAELERDMPRVTPR